MNNSESLPELFPNLGKIIVATRVKTDQPDLKQIKKVIILLACSVGLMMTGFGIILPVFARRLGELGSGVEALGFMTMSFALAQLMAAPFMGSLADRFGRRPLIILSLISFTLANVGFLWAPTIKIFIIIRFFEGALSAGLFPAAMGVVADMVPEKDRGRWIGILMGSYSAGFIFGPAMGGALYDFYGFEAPFAVSAILGFLAFLSASFLVPETRSALILKRERLENLRNPLEKPEIKISIISSLPRPKYIFFTLLFLNFISAFAFAFIEPQMIFYFYDDLGWSTTSFGFVVGTFGMAMVVSQLFLGRLSDRFGRKPIIFIGFILSLSFYFGLAITKVFAMALLFAFIAGIGDALKGPALGAFVLDITKKRHQSRIMGLKESSLALGGVVGPALVAVIGSRVKPQTIFIIAGIIVALGALLSIVVLKEPKKAQHKDDNTVRDLMEKREVAAQAGMRGVIIWAKTIKKKDKTSHGNP